MSTFVDTNNHGTHRMICAFGPLLADNARFVVVASSFGTLRNLPAALRHHFDESRLTLAAVDSLMGEYARLVVAGEAAARGWPQWINIPSKVGQVAAMRQFARQAGPDARARGILINAVCPGLIDTEASRPWFPDMSAAATPDAAAEDVVWLATLPTGTPGPYGQLVRNRRVLPY